jgi:hypothetical protein
MKRCPQCEFIYPDRDHLCDFDETPLVSASESEIAAITNTPEQPALADLAETHSKNFKRRRELRALPIAALFGLTFGLVIVAAYLVVQRFVTSHPPATPTSQLTQSHNISTPSTSPSPSIITSPSPELVSSNEAAQATTPKPTPAQPKSRLGLSTGPPRTDVKSSGKTVILLTTGGKIEADAAWRTKDGVWYRQNGVVSLLKGNRVRMIVGQ